MAGDTHSARTVAELGRRFEEFRDEYRADRQEIREIAKSNVDQRVYDADQRAVDAKIDAVTTSLERSIDVIRKDHDSTKNTLSWVARLLGGTIASGLLAVGMTVLVSR